MSLGNNETETEIEVEIEDEVAKKTLTDQMLEDVRAVKQSTYTGYKRATQSKRKCIEQKNEELINACIKALQEPPPNVGHHAISEFLRHVC